MKKIGLIKEGDDEERLANKLHKEFLRGRMTD
jgi:hypothetical protein